MEIFTKEELERKSIGELFKLRDDNFLTFLKQVNELKAKYKAMLEADLKKLETDFRTNAAAILDTAHQKTHAHTINV